MILRLYLSVLLCCGLGLVFCEAGEQIANGETQKAKKEKKPLTEFEKAIGLIDNLPEEHKKLFELSEHFFKEMPEPEPGDWLSEHPERGQGYERFVVSHPNLPTKEKRTLYILPIGPFPDTVSLKILQEYTATYYQLPAELLPEVSLEEVGATSRKNPFTGDFQLYTVDILNDLILRLPKDAYCLIGVTMTDLYPDPDWNFVFGQATFRERVGIYSFARYDPAFYGNKSGPDDAAIIKKRSLKVMVHELAHMFGLEHCVYLKCVVNGSNHMGESDSQPIHLCPVCLRKLYYSVGFDPIKRYRELLIFYEKQKFTEEAEWVRGRLKEVTTQK